ncbi:MAG: uroporphyrinogen decarboxylase [Myxococcota bacterium]
MNGRQRTLAALHGEAIDRFPVWLMRQAGRFLPEYRDVRAKTTFLDMVRSPALCTEVALQPLRRFPLDATIVFSDILVIPDSLGVGLSFETGDGPKIARPLVDDEVVESLKWDGVCDRLGYVYDAVRQLRAAAPDHALFGFAGSPWTLFAYMAQGKGGGEFATSRAALFTNPERSRRVLMRLADAVGEHLVRQIEAGADVVQVFDSWGGLLPAEDYEEFAVPALLRVKEHVGDAPIVLYVRSGPHLVDVTARLGYTALSVDHVVDLKGVPGSTQGNLDNTRLLGTPEAVREGVRRVHAALRGRRNHVFNLGHGVLPQTPPENVAVFVEEIGRLA